MKTFIITFLITAATSFLVFIILSPRELFTGHIPTSIGIGLGSALGLYYYTKKKKGTVN